MVPRGKAIQSHKVESECIVECPDCREWMRSSPYPRASSDAFARVPQHSRYLLPGVGSQCPGSGMEVAR